MLLVIFSLLLLTSVSSFCISNNHLMHCVNRLPTFQHLDFKNELFLFDFSLIDCHNKTLIQSIKRAIAMTPNLRGIRVICPGDIFPCSYFRYHFRRLLDNCYPFENDFFHATSIRAPTSSSLSNISTFTTSVSSSPPPKISHIFLSPSTRRVLSPSATAMSRSRPKSSKASPPVIFIQSKNNAPPTQIIFEPENGTEKNMIPVNLIFDMLLLLFFVASIIILSTCFLAIHYFYRKYFEINNIEVNIMEMV